MSSTRPAAAAPAKDKQPGGLATEIALLVLLSFLWGGSFTLIKIAIETVPPATIVAARTLIAAMLLALFIGARGLSLPRDGATWAALLVQGLLQSALPFMLISWGERHIPSGLAGVLNATPPVFVLLIGFVLRRATPVDGRRVIGVALGLAGVAITTGTQAFQSLGAAPLAQAAVLGASLCYALAPMWGRRFANLPASVTATGAMACAAALTIPISLVVDRPWTLSPSREALGAVAVLAVLCTAVAMIIYFRLVQTLGALGITSGSYLRAGFSVLLGVLVLGEAFTWSTLIGMALIVFGVVAVNGQLRWPTARTPS